MRLFEQSEATAARRKAWFVCVDDTDGKTAETGLTFSAGELQVLKAGTAFANAAGTVTERSDGLYEYEFTADRAQGRKDRRSHATPSVAGVPEIDATLVL